MNIPFSLPVIDEDVINEMSDTLINTGWLTSGPKTRALEEEVKKYTGVPASLCVNSWTSGAMLVMRWFGVGPGDEVIIPAYTYSATALSIMNMGAVPVMVDVQGDITIDPCKIKEAISERTKVIIPVDIGGWPCDYKKIYEVINSTEILAKYSPVSENQKKLGRILLLSDAAHSIGANINGIQAGHFADMTVFSFHSVKNVTTGEGGAVCLNLPGQFENNKELAYLRALALNGQSKSAFEKNQPGNWRYDIIAQGLKVNMPDICAAVGLAQIRKYRTELLPERKKIFDYYTSIFRNYDWAIIPPYNENGKESSYHLFLLRIAGITEEERDRIIELISQRGVGVNVHYIPMAMLTLFKEKGYKIEYYPVTYELYKNEITLPVYNGLTKEKLDFVIKTVVKACQSIIK